MTEAEIAAFARGVLDREERGERVAFAVGSQDPEAAARILSGGDDVDVVDDDEFDLDPSTAMGAKLLAERERREAARWCAENEPDGGET